MLSFLSNALQHQMSHQMSHQNEQIHIIHFLSSFLFSSI